MFGALGRCSGRSAVVRPLSERSAVVRCTGRKLTMPKKAPKKAPKKRKAAELKRKRSLRKPPKPKDALFFFTQEAKVTLPASVDGWSDLDAREQTRRIKEMFATLGEKLLIPFFIEMRYGNPGVRHFVARAAATINPLIRIRVVGIIGCVVVPLLEH